MKHRLLVFFLLNGCLHMTTSAQLRLWTDVSPTTAITNTHKHSGSPTTSRLVQLNPAFAKYLQPPTMLENRRHSKGSHLTAFQLPLPQGGTLPCAVQESSILSAALQAQHPSLKTYQVLDASGKQHTGRFTITPEGINGLLFTDSGTVYVVPVTDGAAGLHRVYYQQDVPAPSPVRCTIREDLHQHSGLEQEGAFSGDCQLKTFRLAVAATGEYTTWAGSAAAALNHITIAINNVTAIYERELGIRFTLVTTNDIIFTDAVTDPYPTIPLPNADYLNINHTYCNLLGADSYDLAIVFNNAWDGGMAFQGVVCNAGSKGCAAAGLTFGTGANPTPGPQGPIFEGAVAHELAHLFNATHSYAATNADCGGVNVHGPTAWEPGGGSTIMSYAGACAPNFYQLRTDHYFHAGSLGQIQAYVNGSSASCKITSPLTNTAPTVQVAATTYTIPAATPFLLSAVTNDADGHTLTHTWEQMDAGFTSDAPPSATNPLGPNFRSWPPVQSTARSFPRIQTLLTGNISSAYEVLPTISKTMHFRLTIRDGAPGGGCCTGATVTVNTVAGAGPFRVTSQNTPEEWIANGSNTALIRWNVANSDQLPVQCTHVNILWSADGGLTWSTTLLANTPNDGEASIVIPATPTGQGRVQVQAVNNIFFSINTAPVTVSLTVLPVQFLPVTAREDGQQVVLAWGTTSETNSDRFELKRSSDGVLFNETIGSLPAKGSSATITTYQLIDPTPQPSWNFYQVWQFDKDGRQTRSNIARINMAGTVSTAVLHPNPAHSTVTLDYVAAKREVIQLMIVDVNGAVLARSVFAVHPGKNTTTFPVAQYARGIYYLHLVGKSERIIRRLIRN